MKWVYKHTCDSQHENSIARMQSIHTFWPWTRTGLQIEILLSILEGSQATHSVGEDPLDTCLVKRMRQYASLQVSEIDCSAITRHGCPCPYAERCNSMHTGSKLRYRICTIQRTCKERARLGVPSICHWLDPVAHPILRFKVKCGNGHTNEFQG